MGFEINYWVWKKLGWFAPLSIVQWRNNEKITRFSYIHHAMDGGMGFMFNLLGLMGSLKLDIQLMSKEIVNFNKTYD